MLLRVSNKILPFCGKNLRVFPQRDVKLEETGFLMTPSKTFTCLKKNTKVKSATVKTL